MRGKIAILTVILVAALSSIFFGHTAYATPCSSEKPSRVLFVRGSGENISGDTFHKLKQGLEKNLPSSQYMLHELSASILTNSVINEDYEAVPVFGGMNSLVGLTATVSMGSIGKYRESVNSGRAILNQYLLDLNDGCVVLVGYSQGAHVIGEILEEIKIYHPELLKKIRYVGLLGDPRFDSYGYGVFPGQNVPWYRGDAIVGAQGGLLGRRWPNYIPRDVFENQKTFTPSSSWCSINDPVCSSNIPAFSLNEHNRYGITAIPQMALEIANVINNPSGIVDKNKRPAETCGAPKQDIVVLLDTSAAMRREASLFTDTKMYYGGQSGQLPPTAGEMLARTGCGDTRFAVMGYGEAGNESPKLLLNFTSDPKKYDALMKSLYSPSSTGTYGRTPFREGAIKALELDWRINASKTIVAITDIAGSGHTGVEGWRPWSDARTSQQYLSDPLSQQLITMARKKDAIIIGIPVTHSFSGLNRVSGDPTNTEAQTYLQMFSRATGGYMWVKQVPSYNAYNFKYTLVDQTINYANQLREKSVVSTASVRGMVGQPLTLTVNDPLSLLAAVEMRKDSASYEWRIDCDDKLKTPLYDNRRSVTFVPSKAQKCLAAVVVRAGQATGAGCYTCPEIFPPYLYKVLSFNIDIKPANYIAKIPGKITDLTKVIADNTVRYNWSAPSYSGDIADIVYVVRESDGTVLAATTARELVITDTARSDPKIMIGVAGEDGHSEAVLSSNASIVDIRTPSNTGIVVEQPIGETIDVKVPLQPISKTVEPEIILNPEPGRPLRVVASTNISPAQTSSPVSDVDQIIGESETTPAVLGEQSASDQMATASVPSAALADTVNPEQGIGNIWWLSIPLLILLVGIVVRLLTKLNS